ncbi:MAG: CBS domain-containing protein [Candidatus Roizmanbacteria bacterium]
MLYFSELKGRSVIDQNGTYVGRLDDLVFKSAPTAPVTKLLVRDSSGFQHLIQYSAVIKINDLIKIDSSIPRTNLDENELFVGKNISDQQIIDISGSKMVRVNDVIFVQHPTLRISGVDVGFLGLMRWLCIENVFIRISRLLRKPISPRFLSWADVAPLELGRGRVMMRKQETNLKKLNPEDLAGYLDRTNIRNVRRIVSLLDEKYAAEVINNLNVTFQTTLFKSFPSDRSAKILALLDTDDAVDILMTLDRHTRAKIVALLSQEKQDEINALVHISRTPLGDAVSLEFYEVGADWTAGRVKKMISSEAESSMQAPSIYVINNEEQLVGAFNLFELIEQHDETPVYKFMVQNLVTLHLSTPKELAWKKMQKYRFSSLPVIDNEKKLIGVARWFDVSP